MTKEQAIEILRECVTSGRAITNGCHINDTEYEVLKIAIKALEQQPSDDCEYNRGYRDGYDKGNLNGYELRKAEEKTSDDCVSRKELIAYLTSTVGLSDEDMEKVLMAINDVPPVTLTFPKGATNGDILKIIFPNIEWEEIHDLKGNKNIGCTNKFWNEPYKRGDLDG